MTDWKATVFARDRTIESLQGRIRELEAELAKMNGLAYGWNAAMRQEQARAEKAENFVRELKAEVSDVTLERNKCQARVAELERDNDPVKWGERIALKAAREAREREEC